MRITDFAKQVTLHEGNKKNQSIAQIAETLNITNSLTNGELYKSIRNLSSTSSYKKSSTPSSRRQLASKKISSKNASSKKGSSKKN